MRRVSFERTAGAVDRTFTWVRRNEDFCADFHSAGLRSLPRHLYQFFSFYHLHNGKMELLCQRLGLSDRAAWDFVIQIETIVGREIALMQPYSLFPPRGYMMPMGRGAMRSDGEQNFRLGEKSLRPGEKNLRLAS